MTQGFKYFMVFLSQSTKEKNERKKKKVEKRPVTENVPHKLFKPCPDFKSISIRCITNKMKEPHGSNTDMSGSLALRLQFRCHCQPYQCKKD